MAIYDTPGIWRGTQKDFKEIFFSLPEHALHIPITLQAGYGVLEAGTVLAMNLSAASPNYGKFVPYTPTTIAGAYDPGRAYLASNGAGTTAVVLKTEEDTYKFAVGDNLVAADSDTAAVDLGAITAIDRVTKTITVTNALPSTITTSANGWVSVLNGAAAGTADAIGILFTTRETGTGADAAGAPSSIILGTAILYTGCLVLYDAAAKTDLGTTDIGRFTHLK